MSKEVSKKEESKKPIKTFRAGQISASIFAHKKEVNKKQLTFYSTKIVKSYKTEEDEWKETTSYNREDLIKVLIVTNKSAEYIYLQEMNDEDDE